MKPIRYRRPLRAATAFLAAGSLTAALAAAAAAPPLEFTDVEKQTLQFLQHYHNIELTPAQEQLKNEALRRLPAPCCNDRSAATCCCECNMARAWWGLTKHLIVDRGYDADQITETVAQWFEFINPAGFSGDSCYNGGCGRPFAQNGCGGMVERALVF